MNLLDATATDGAARAGSLSVPLSALQVDRLTSERVVLGVRPEGFSVASEGGLDVDVELVEELGSESCLYCVAAGIPDKQIVARTGGLSGSRRGDRIGLVPDPAIVHVFNAASGVRLAAG